MTQRVGKLRWVFCFIFSLFGFGGGEFGFPGQDPVSVHQPTETYKHTDSFEKKPAPNGRILWKAFGKANEKRSRVGAPGKLCIIKYGDIMAYIFFLSTMPAFAIHTHTSSVTVFAYTGRGGGCLRGPWKAQPEMCTPMAWTSDNLWLWLLTWHLFVPRPYQYARLCGVLVTTYWTSSVRFCRKCFEARSEWIWIGVEFENGLKAQQQAVKKEPQHRCCQ